MTNSGARGALFAFSVLVLMGASARARSVGDLLPRDREISGWSVYPNTYLYCPKPEDFVEIYDGGFELYTDNGAVEAAAQLYKKEKATAEVVVHRMKTWQHAKAFFKHWLKERNSKDLIKAPVVVNDSFLAREGRTTAGYLWRGTCFATVKINATGRSAEAATLSFLKLISQKAGA